MKIGIGITSVNGIRGDVFKYGVKMHEENNLNDSFEYSVHFDNPNNRKGIAKSKNYCLRELMALGCDHIFLFDDDTWPIGHDWYNKFIVSAFLNNQHHLSYLPERGNYMGQLSNIVRPREFGEGLLIYPYSWGCMLYFDRHCIETCGGYNEEFEIYGYEHCELSMRIYNMGQCDNPYMTIENVWDYIYACDFEGFPKGLEPKNHSLDGIQVQKYLDKNEQLFKKMYKSDKKIPL